MWNVKGPCRHKETWWWNEEVAEAVREKDSMKIGREKTLQRRGRSTRGVDKMQRGLFPQQRERNGRNVQMIQMILSIKMKFFEWQSRW